MEKVMTISELRGELSASIRGIRSGCETAANANAISNAVGKILATVRLEMEYCKLTGKIPEIPLLQAVKKK